MPSKSKVKSYGVAYKALEALLEPVEGKWLAELVATHSEMAEKCAKRFADEIKAGTLKRRDTDRWLFPTAYRYIKLPDDWNRGLTSFPAERADEVKPNYAFAKRMAEDEYKEARMFFLNRAADKVGHMFGDLAVKVDGKFDFRHNLIHGEFFAESAEAKVDLETTLKWNYRYGINSANGVLTTYMQFPMVVRKAVVRGEEIENGEDAVAALLTGETREVKKRRSLELKARIDAKRVAIAKLDREKGAVNDLLTQYSFIEQDQKWMKVKGDTPDRMYARSIEHSKQEIAQICKRYGIEDLGSKRACLDRRKEIKSQIDILKAEILKMKQEEA